MNVLTPKTPLDQCYRENPITIFLAGSIEMDSADRWQDRIINRFKNERVTFFNPRRDDWDSSIEQTANDPRFRQQVEWELEMLDKADLIVMYFQPFTMSPVSLIEFGLFSNQFNHMVVCCPEGFHRKGNVDIVCEWHRTRTVKNFKELLDYIEKWIREGE